MNSLVLFFGLALPTLAGALICLAISAPKHRHLSIVAIGYGACLGWMALGGIRILLTTLALPASTRVITGVLLLGAAIAAGVLWRRHRARAFDARVALRVLKPVAAPLVLIAIALTTITISIRAQPTFGWDAWDFWSILTKTWINTGRYDFRITSLYPPAMPMMHLWLADWLGPPFDDASSNLVVIPPMVAFLLATYGFLRFHQVPSPSAAWLLAIIALTPLFTIHAALPGYADLMQSIFIALTLMAASLFIILSDQNARIHKTSLAWYVLGLACVASLKRPGIFWAIVCCAPIAWFFFRLLSRRWQFVAGIVFAPLALATLYWLDKTQGYHVLSAIRNNRPSELNAAYLVLTSVFHSELLPLSLAMGSIGVALRTQTRPPRDIVLPLLTIAVVPIMLFVGMLYYQTAEFWSTVLSRALLHFVPALIVFGACFVFRRTTMTARP